MGLGLSVAGLIAGGAEQGGFGLHFAVIDDHEVGGTVAFHDDYTRVAAVLAAHGVRPPCRISGVQYLPIAWYAGCASQGPSGPGEAEAVIVQSTGPPPAYARTWPAYRITGTRILKVNAYIRRR